MLCTISVSAQFITAPTPTLANVLTAHTESSVGELPLPTVLADEAGPVDAHVDAKQTPHTEHSVGELPAPTLIGRKRAPKGGRREAFRG